MCHKVLLVKSPKPRDVVLHMEFSGDWKISEVASVANRVKAVRVGTCGNKFLGRHRGTEINIWLIWKKKLGLCKNLLLLFTFFSSP